jgi:hypothetical protein
MSPESLYHWSLLTLAILVLLQLLAGAIVLVIATLYIHRLQANCRRVLQKGLILLERMDSILIQTVDTTRELSKWCEQVSTAAGRTSSAITEVDKKVEQALAYMQETTTRWTKYSDNLLNRFSGASERAHQAILDPASRLSVLLGAVQTTLSHLRPKEGKEEDPSRYHTDQEIFI